MADYVKFTMPRKQAERLLELAKIGAEMQATPDTWQLADGMIVQRLKLAVCRKDMRVANRFPKMPKDRKPRVGLDLRRTA